VGGGMMKCRYCGKEYKSFKAFNEHLMKHEIWIERARKNIPSPNTPPNIGNCRFCGKFVIAPSIELSYGSYNNLIADGFTGDVDPVYGVICIDCMKKHDWTWGEEEEEEEEDEG
jgi:hypothetical protein